MSIDLATIGLLTIIAGITLVFLGIATQQKGRVEGGAAIFIGPLPIIGATSQPTFYFLLILSIALLLIFVVFPLIGWKIV